MKGDPKVIEYLNRSLKSELTAINQYFLHARMLENWGLMRLAKYEYKESIEEMVHADNFIKRILFLEGLPNLQELDRLMIGENVREIFESDLKAEHGARALYIEAIAYCEQVKDYVTRDLFEHVLKDEESHIDFIETQLDLMNRVGAENYTHQQIHGGDDDD